MSEFIKNIKDGLDTIYPITKTSAVYDDSSNTLDTILTGKQDTISDLAEIRAGATSGASAYQKSADGIPSTDMTTAVQTSLGLADTALQSHQDISGKLDKNEAITGATKCKITYDAKGLVTAGSDLSASDIPSLDASKIGSGTFADARIASASTWNGKQARHSTVTGTLATSGWSSSAQTISVSGVTASNTVIVSPAPASQTAYANAQVYCTAQGSGTLTFSCTDTPTAAITVNVVILN